MKIWTLPLEPIEQRYTKQWRQQFEDVFKQQNVDHEFIDGDLVESTLKGKFFLDPIQTNIWKFSQLEKLLKSIDKVENDDVIFLFDGWFPGVEAIKYTLTFLNKETKIMSYFHAGTYDEYDLTNQFGMEQWGKDLENSWFELYDKILVATEFHKSMICSKRDVDENKIKVIGFPLDIERLMNQYNTPTKQNLIAFTGRKSVEKGYDDVLELQRQGFPIVVTLDETKTKDEYYRLLAKSKYVISTSQQETFGIGIVEGMALGCIPIVPKRLSYIETVGEYCREDYIVDNLKNILDDMNDLDRNIFVEKANRYQYQNVINNILEEL